MRTLQLIRDRVFSARTPEISSRASPPVDHADLRFCLMRVQHVVAERVRDDRRGRRAAAASRACLRELSGLEETLSSHFQGEEADGPLADTLQVAPRYADRAEALQAEHVTLAREFATIRALGAICVGAPARWSELDSRLSTFARRLRAHEHAENEISSCVFLEDLGTQD